MKCNEMFIKKSWKRKKGNQRKNRKEVKCNLFEKPSKENPYVDYHFLDAFLS